MKNKSAFSQIMTAVIIALICIAITVVIAFLVGSADEDLLDFSSMNWSNVILVIAIGGFISCVVVGIVVLFAANNIFTKFKDTLLEKEDGGKEK